MQSMKRSFHRPRRPSCRRHAGAWRPGAAGHDETVSRAGEPGIRRSRARVVEVIMREDDGTMAVRARQDRGAKERANPASSSRNDGAAQARVHRSRATKTIDKHAALMQKFPGHGARRSECKNVDPGKSVEILWRFSKARRLRIRLPDPGPSRSRHARQRAREIMRAIETRRRR